MTHIALYEHLARCMHFMANVLLWLFQKCMPKFISANSSWLATSSLRKTSGCLTTFSTAVCARAQVSRTMTAKWPLRDIAMWVLPWRKTVGMHGWLLKAKMFFRSNSSVPIFVAALRFYSMIACQIYMNGSWNWNYNFVHCSLCCAY